MSRNNRFQQINISLFFPSTKKNRCSRVLSNSFVLTQTGNYSLTCFFTCIVLFNTLRKLTCAKKKVVVLTSNRTTTRFLFLLLSFTAFSRVSQKKKSKRIIVRGLFPFFDKGEKERGRKTRKAKRTLNFISCKNKKI